MYYTEGGEPLAQVAHSGGGCPIPGNIQGCSEQPGLVEGGPAPDRGLELDDL